MPCVHFQLCFTTPIGEQHHFFFNLHHNTIQHFLLKFFIQSSRSIIHETFTIIIQPILQSAWLFKATDAQKLAKPEQSPRGLLKSHCTTLFVLRRWPRENGPQVKAFTGQHSPEAKKQVRIPCVQHVTVRHAYPNHQVIKSIRGPLPLKFGANVFCHFGLMFGFSSRPCVKTSLPFCPNTTFFILIRYPSIH